MARINERTWIHHRGRRDKCINLVRSIYGNVDAALRWQKALDSYAQITKSNVFRAKQTHVCYTKNDKDKICLVIAVHMDDVLMAGESENMKCFKDQSRKTYNFTDLGKLKRHLGI